MAEITSPAPTSDDFGDVDISGLVDALDLTPDERAHFSSHNEETVSTESAEVAPEVDEPAVVEEKVEAPAAETEGETDPKAEKPEGDGVQKRIDKLTAEKYAAREEAEALKAQLTQLQQKLSQQPIQSAPATVPLSHVNSQAELMEAREKALQAKEFALMNPHGGTYTAAGKDGQPEEINLSDEQIRTLLVNANRMLDRDIPARAAYLNEAQGHFAEARRVYPHLFDPKNPDSILANQYLQVAPWLRNFPDWACVLGDTVTGYRIRMAKAAQPKEAVQTLAPNPAKAKIIGSPKGQAGPRVHAIKSTADLVASGRNELSFDEATGLLDEFLR